jgi:osmotically-inducible protein OsmY
MTLWNRHFAQQAHVRKEDKVMWQFTTKSLGRLLKIAFCVTMLFTTISCVPLLIGGGGIAAVASGKVLSQEKTVGTSISDTTIWTKIKTSLSNKGIDHIVMGKISIEVDEGHVLLTGSVPDKDKIITILKTCWSVNGVKEVINELKITDKKEEGGIFNTTSDAWITSKIKGKLLANTKIHSTNYSVETIKGIVYLLGIAQSQDELDTLVDLASNTSGVEKVVSYVRVKKDLDKRLSETRGNKEVLSPKEDKPLMDYNFDYSNIHKGEKEQDKPGIIQPNKIDEDDIFDDDF